VLFDGGVVDSAAGFGTVVFQSLPANVTDTMPGQQVDVILAVRSSPACSAGQLALSYLGGGPGAGNDFGTLLIRDISARPCTLKGPLQVTGLDGAGRPDTETVRDQVAGVTVLSPRAIQRQGTALGELVGVLVLGAEYRDGPATVDNGSCVPLWVIPTSWRILVPGGQYLTVANADRASPVKLVGSGGLVTCRGQLGAPGPAYVGSP